MRLVRTAPGLFVAVLFWVLVGLPTPLLAAKAKTEKIDINTATQQELESLPGVGAATAMKIIAGRPYSSIQALSKVGVPEKTIEKIAPLVKAGRGAAEKPAMATSAPMPATREDKKPGQKEKAPTAVDLNTASQKELEALPQVGAATAKKIIAGRPYSSVADLSKAGVGSKTIQKISPLVTVGTVPAAASSPSRDGAAPAQPPGSSRPSRPSGASASARESAPAAPAAQAPPQKGMVWVNLETKVFHREGDHWYGNTKHGKYMTEADALKAGYRESRQKLSKQ